MFDYRPEVFHLSTVVTRRRRPRRHRHVHEFSIGRRHHRRRRRRHRRHRHVHKVSLSVPRPSLFSLPKLLINLKLINQFKCRRRNNDSLHNLPPFVLGASIMPWARYDAHGWIQRYK